jgi:hypothetical protein
MLINVPPTSTISNSAFCPQGVFMGFELFSELTAIISLNNVNQLIFVIETRRVFFAVRTECLNIVSTSFRIKLDKVFRDFTRS